ncbi:hypothetical protein [Bacillus cereus]
MVFNLGGVDTTVWTVSSNEFVLNSVTCVHLDGYEGEVNVEFLKEVVG